MKRIGKKDLGKACLWHGFDGKDYLGTITAIKRGIVQVSYFVPSMGDFVTALVDHRDYGRIKTRI